MIARRKETKMAFGVVQHLHEKHDSLEDTLFTVRDLVRPSRSGEDTDQK